MLHETSDTLPSAMEGNVRRERSENTLSGSQNEKLDLKVELPEDEYPDGGLRAWLVVFGVSRLWFNVASF